MIYIREYLHVGSDENIYMYESNEMMEGSETLMGSYRKIRCEK